MRHEAICALQRYQSFRCYACGDWSGARESERAGTLFAVGEPGAYYLKCDALAFTRWLFAAQAFASECTDAGEESQYSDGLVGSGCADLGQGSVGFLPWPVIIAALVIVVGYIILKRTIFGRHIYAIGGNEQAARLSGIRVKRTLIWVDTISGICTGIAGVIFAARLLSGQPAAGQGYELDAIAAVILGGTSFTGGLGSIVGTAIGAFIIGVLNNGMVLMNVPFFYQLIIQGLVIIAAVMLDRFRVSRLRAA
jgi:Predicted ABC-type sugar transport system, permease component